MGVATPPGSIRYGVLRAAIWEDGHSAGGGGLSRPPTLRRKGDGDELLERFLCKGKGSSSRQG